MITLPFKICIVCGRSENLTRLSFQHKRVTALTQLAGCAGNVGFLAEYFVNRALLFDAPFCSPCAEKYVSLPKASQLLHLAWVSIIFVAILATYFLNGICGDVGFILGLLTVVFTRVAIRIYWSSYVKKTSPNFEKLTANEAIVRIPGRSLNSSRVVATKF